MTAGYSGTPLPRKLGIGDGSRVLVLGAPADVALDAPHHVRAGRAGYDVQLLFCPDAATLRRRWPGASARSTERGAGVGRPKHVRWINAAAEQGGGPRVRMEHKRASGCAPT